MACKYIELYFDTAINSVQASSAQVFMFIMVKNYCVAFATALFFNE
jgi:hypothetical protein